MVIDNSELSIIRARKANLGKLIIKNRELNNVDFDGSIINELMIDSSELLDFTCYGCIV